MQTIIRVNLNEFNDCSSLTGLLTLNVNLIMLICQTANITSAIPSFSYVEYMLQYKRSTERHLL